MLRKGAICDLRFIQEKWSLQSYTFVFIPRWDELFWGWVLCGVSCLWGELSVILSRLFNKYTHSENKKNNMLFFKSCVFNVCATIQIVSYRYFTIEIAEIIVQSLLKTNWLQYKMTAAFTLDFVAMVNITWLPEMPKWPRLSI